MAADTIDGGVRRGPAFNWRVALPALVFLILAAAVLVAALIADGNAPVREDTAFTPADLTPEFVSHLEKHPEDSRAWAIHARLAFGRGDYGASAASYARAVERPGKISRDPLVWCEYADAVAMAAGGSLQGKPRELISRALMLNADHSRALEMAGSAAIEAGDYKTAVEYWERLLKVLPPDAPERGELTKAVERARMRTGF